MDAVVIGSGVVGLAIARSLASDGRSVLILEKEAQFGTGISSRSSEVIHAGIHYPHGSLKERLCLEGKRKLYAYCEERHIAHRKTGKLTVATSEAELARLEEIALHSREAEADEQATWLDRDDVSAMESALSCVAAWHTPSSGIVDSHGLMLSLLGEAQDHGALIATHARVEHVEKAGDLWRIRSGDTSIEARFVVNAAGLDAQAVAASIDTLAPALIPARHLAKATYFTYSGKVPFSRLIYPIPEQGGLGTHLTLDIAGQARFGPDVEWIEEIDYSVEPGRKAEYVYAVRRFWPDVDPEKLAPGYAGIRPKIAGPGEPDADFMIQDLSDHDLPGLINLFGIESPGLTSSLAIADHVAMALRQCA